LNLSRPGVSLVVPTICRKACTDAQATSYPHSCDSPTSAQVQSRRHHSCRLTVELSGARADV
jgi:hypothetical protein